MRCTAVALFVGSLLSLALPGAARADRTFAVRFSTDTTGRIAMIANTLMTCPASASGCSAAQQAPSANNNDFNMVFVNVDPDGGNNSTLPRLAVIAC
jgi:hypothetical protein